MEARGQTSLSHLEIKERSFPTLLQTKFKNMSFGEMHEYLFEEERKGEASNFATFDTFRQYYLTPEGSKFYLDVYGYEGDVVEGAEGIVEFYSLLDTELTGEAIRPKEGMPALTRALARSAVELGAKLYSGSRYEITSISKELNKYLLTTFKKKWITATKLVIAVPPGPLKKIGGTLAERIQREPAFQSEKANPAFKAAAVYSRAWWEDITDECKSFNSTKWFLSNSDCLGWTFPHRFVIKSYFPFNFNHDI